MNQRRWYFLVIIGMLMFSSVFCISPANEGDGEPNLTATLAVIQGTQTAMAAVPSATTAQISPSPTIALPTEIPTSELTAQVGSVSGKLSFPSEGVPPLRVIAFNINSGYYYYVETAANQSNYQINNLPPGTYHVVAYVMDGNFAGGYSQAVPCGLAVGCDDHSLIDIQLAAGQDVTNADPGDWYAPDNSFPQDPVAPPPQAPVNGSIAGNLSYPSEAIPPLHVVAFNLDTNQHYYTTTTANQFNYQIDNLPPGNYHIVAYVQGENFGGGYSHAVPCGLSVDCNDHSLIVVTVSSGQVTQGIDPGDWYAPDCSFPPNPI